MPHIKGTITIPTISRTKEHLKDTFEYFSHFRCWPGSPLYFHITSAIANDDDLLSLASQCAPRQPVPHLLLAAVHFLLLGGKIDPLAQYYPDLTHKPLPPSEAYPAFRAFCLHHQEEIIQIVRTHKVQTNEPRRCAYLFLAFSRIAQETGKPLALVEPGTSAGLNLLWYLYRYNYVTMQGNVLQAGDETSPVVIDTLLQGDCLPEPPLFLPRVLSSTGIDQRILDASNPDDVLWLRALVWPEHQDRAALLTAALEIMRESPPDLCTGEAAFLLPEVLESLPLEATPVVFHTHVLNQLPPEHIEQVTNIMLAQSKHRDFFQVGNDLESSEVPGQSILTLRHYHQGAYTEQHIATVDVYGRWITWLWDQ